ncbi:MAG TPA: head maturation protease, ClpP-related [Geminicoccus sp.]|uniref:head maturation protease, ClpP-related n=1 Tax=Geminicoccus sp. TaxID=2024832 RepID=UPI002D036FD4|nr:head maturation protease, ClpP-related [Geminicoccus sp.]HWL70421.1 head maturation protease, ClpP-related [Geminicoccus sp.]
MAKRRWFEARATGERAAEVMIYDDIGMWGLRAKDFIEEVKALGDLDKITVGINSYGGEVFDGLAIYNFLNRQKGEVVIRVDGLAASIASVIAMAGDEIIMPENAMMMIHDPSGLVWGRADDMREMADVLDKMKGSLISAYRDKSGMEDEEIAQLMRNETWLDAADAKKRGLADTISKPVSITNRADLGDRFSNVPAALACVDGPRGESADPPASEDIMADDKKTPPADGAKPADLDAAIAEATAKANARASQITALATMAHRAGYANAIADATALIASSKDMAEIQAHFLDKSARAEGEEIDNKHDASQPRNDGKAGGYGKAKAWGDLYANIGARNGLKS